MNAIARHYTSVFSYQWRRRLFVAQALGKPIIASIAAVLTEQATIAAAVAFALVGMWSALESLVAESPRSMKERMERESGDLPRIDPTTDISRVQIIHEAVDPSGPTELP